MRGFLGRRQVDSTNFSETTSTNFISSSRFLPGVICVSEPPHVVVSPSYSRFGGRWPRFRPSRSLSPNRSPWRISWSGLACARPWEPASGPRFWKLRELGPGKPWLVQARGVCKALFVETRGTHRQRPGAMADLLCNHLCSGLTEQAGGAWRGTDA